MGETGQGPVVPSGRGPVDARRRRVIDLGLVLDRTEGRPLADQLEQLLGDRIGCGELHPGDALPSTRALAAELEVSRGIVVEAYDRLIRQGLLVARQGAAVRVSASLPPVVTPAEPGEPTAPPPALTRLSLHPAATPIGTFDRRQWAAAARTVLREAPEAELASLDATGVAALRDVLAEQLSRSRGVVAAPGRFAITSGVSDALRGLAPVLRARGGRVAVEDPGFALHRATLMAAGLEVVPVPVDAEGLDPAALAGTDVAAVLLTPAHQMPLGVPLPPARRAALVDWSRRTGAWLIEDDYDGELRYDRRSVRSLHGLAPDRVIYLGTTSKVLSPAVRIGWLVAPPELAPEVLGWRLAAGATPSNVDQLTLAELIRSGRFDRGIARLRRRCAAQRAALVEAVAVAAPELRPTGVAAGLNLTLRVPGLSSWPLVIAAGERGVELFAADDGGDALLLVGFGLVDPSAAPAVARELAEIVAAARAQI